MLTFILKKEWFDKIKRGEKTVEYREAKPYWDRRVYSLLQCELRCIGENTHAIYQNDCIFRLGYTKKILKGKITRVEKMNGKETDLKIDKPVYAFYFYLMPF